MSNKKPNYPEKTFVSKLLFESNYQGSHAALAKQLGVSRQRWWNWCNVDNFIPEQHVTQLASILGIGEIDLAKLMLDHSKQESRK